MITTKFDIIADGGSKIGMGHIMRTLALAKELARTNDVFYICRVDDHLFSRYKSGMDNTKFYGLKW